MKANIINILVVTFLFGALFGCDDNMGETDARMAAVQTLVEPSDGKSIKLEASASTDLYFEWDYINAAEAGTFVYQIAFDKLEGDFSNPVYLVAADNNGLGNHASLTHKQLNKIAGMMGIAASETGSFKWTVFSSKGTQRMKSGEEHLLTVTRLAGFADIPIDVFVTGEGSEGGTGLAKAARMKAIAGGEFEIYTKLTAGKPFYFTDGTQSSARRFYTSDGLIKENGTSTVKTDGVYRVTLDFNTGACTYTLVTRVGFYFSPQGEILFDLPYVGNGVFQAKATVTFKQESWGRDERYKFRMFIREDGGSGEETEVEWGTLNGTDSRPMPNSPESYYYMQLLTGSGLTQWDNKWKLMGDFDGVPATYTIYLTGDRPYTHSITK